MRGLRVASCTSVKTATQGISADIYRVTITYASDAPRAPRSVIVKLSSSVAAMRQRPNTLAAYRREVRFYRQVAATIDAPLARCYHAAVDAETGYHALVLEDLGEDVTLSDEDGCPPDLATLAIDAITPLHARWWGRINEARAAEIVDVAQDAPPDPAALQRAHEEWLPVFFAAAGDQLQAQHVALAEALGDYRPRLWRALFLSEPRTLLHRDYSVANLVFGHAPSRAPVTVIDWQRFGPGRGAWDIAWLLGQSLTIEQRQQSAEAHIVRYHAALTDQGVRGYSLDACRRDYALALVQRFGSLISTIAAMPLLPDQLARIVDVMLPRNLAALDDHDAFAALKELPP